MSGVTPEDRDDFMQANIDDLNAALSHLGFDNMEDFHQWALDENELKRFDQLCLLLTRHRQAAYAAGRADERGRAIKTAHAVAESFQEPVQSDYDMRQGAMDVAEALKKAAIAATPGMLEALREAEKDMLSLAENADLIGSKSMTDFANEAAKKIRAAIAAAENKI